jgi:hypothetical protein
VFGGLVTGAFAKGALTGIMGMAWGQYMSPNLQKTPFESLVAAGEIEDVFSICMNFTHGGGAMVWGDVGMYHTGQMQYTPLATPPDLWPSCSGAVSGSALLGEYAISMTSVQFGDSSVPINISTNCIGGCQDNPAFQRLFDEGVPVQVDSGTTIWTVQPETLQSMKAAAIDICERGYALPHFCLAGGSTIVNTPIWNGTLGPVTMTREEYEATVAAWPDITVEFAGGVVVTVPPTVYIPFAGEQTVQTGVAIMINPGVVTTCPSMILGDTFMGAFNVAFDRGQSRIGFAPVSNCPSPTKNPNYR